MNQPETIGSIVKTVVPGKTVSPELAALRDAQGRVQERRDAKERGRDRPRAATLWEAAGVPERHRGSAKELAAGPSGAWGEAAAKVTALERGALVALIGRRGTGKTQIAVQLVRETCKRGQSALYLTAMEVFLRLRATYQDKVAETELGVLRALAKPAVLVIDEVQERAETAFEDRVLTHLIDRRYGAMKTTVLIGNLKPSQLQPSLGDSVSSRLQETGGVIECDWPSFRQPPCTT